MWSDLVKKYVKSRHIGRVFVMSGMFWVRFGHDVWDIEAYSTCFSHVRYVFGPILARVRCILDPFATGNGLWVWKGRCFGLTRMLWGPGTVWGAIFSWNRSSDASFW